MWLSQNIKFGADTNYNSTALGEISISGAKLSVVTQGEQRELKMAMQKGFFWRPQIGERVLVLTCDDGVPIVIGAIQDPSDDLDTGELLIEGENASITLNSEGEIHLDAQKIYINGDMNFSGELIINGSEYVPYTGGLF